jgi:predicted DNA-binding ribbon-helix-helix protein
MSTAGHVSEKNSGYLKSSVLKRSVIVGRHRTSVSLEDPFWNELRAIATERQIELSELIGGIDSERQCANLSSAIRIFVFEHRRNQAASACRQN